MSSSVPESNIPKKDPNYYCEQDIQINKDRKISNSNLKAYMMDLEATYSTKQWVFYSQGNSNVISVLKGIWLSATAHALPLRQ